LFFRYAFNFIKKKDGSITNGNYKRLPQVIGGGASSLDLIYLNPNLGIYFIVSSKVADLIFNSPPSLSSSSYVNIFKVQWLKIEEKKSNNLFWTFALILMGTSTLMSIFFVCYFYCKRRRNNENNINEMDVVNNDNHHVDNDDDDNDGDNDGDDNNHNINNINGGNNNNNNNDNLPTNNS
jgi:hypothetical protein